MSKPTEWQTMDKLGRTITDLITIADTVQEPVIRRVLVEGLVRAKNDANLLKSLMIERTRDSK